jgi:hypothetical protein
MMAWAREAAGGEGSVEIGGRFYMDQSIAGGRQFPSDGGDELFKMLKPGAFSRHAAVVEDGTSYTA